MPGAGEMGLYELLRAAIQDRKQVVGVYDGLRREFCPQVLGLSGWNKRVLVFQFGGETSKGPIRSPETGEWRCFDVERLKSPRLRDGEWYSGFGATLKQTCIEVVDIDARPRVFEVR